MDVKPLTSGIAGFLLGGLVVSVAATQLEDSSGSGATMSQMTDDLSGKSGDAYDQAFLAGMIEHHQGALDMAKQSEERARHEEIKQLSQQIIESQEAEIARMRQWQRDWGYAEQAEGSDHSGH